MQLRHPQRFGCQVDTQNLSPLTRHGIRQNAAATTYVQHLPALQRAQLRYPVQPQRVDLVQRPELAVLVPPAVGELGKLGQFGSIDVGAGSHWQIIGN